MCRHRRQALAPRERRVLIGRLDVKGQSHYRREGVLSDGDTAAIKSLLSADF